MLSGLFPYDKEKFSEILKMDRENASIPRYSLPGINTLKTLNITNTVDSLIKDFSEDKRVSQKEIVEIAIVEFLKKYGYSEQVKAVLHI